VKKNTQENALRFKWFDDTIIILGINPHYEGLNIIFMR